MPRLPAKEPRPGAAGKHDPVAGDPPFLRDHRGNPAARGFDAAHRAARQDRGTPAPRHLGDRGCGVLRLGLAVARRKEAAGPVAAEPRQQFGRLGAGQQTGVELVLPCMVEPGFELAQFGRGLRQIHDAGLAKAGLGLDPLVHPLPQPQALDDQRQFARIAPHLAAPAPIAARLLAGDVPLFAQRDGHPLFRQKQRGARPDDAAADNHDIGAPRQRLVGTDRIDARRHRSADRRPRESGGPGPASERWCSGFPLSRE